MARINTVQRAKKDQGSCGRCGKPITPGMPYRWRKPRYGGKSIRCMDSACGFRPSEMTGSAHLQTIYGAQEDWQEAYARYTRGESDIAALADDLESASQAIREEGESYQESADNQGEYFPGSEQVETAEANATSCGETADRADELVGTLRDVVEALENAAEILDELEVN